MNLMDDSGNIPLHTSVRLDYLGSYHATVQDTFYEKQWASGTWVHLKFNSGTIKISMIS